METQLKHQSTFFSRHSRSSLAACRKFCARLRVAPVHHSSVHLTGTHRPCQVGSSSCGFFGQRKRQELALNKCVWHFLGTPTHPPARQKNKKEQIQKQTSMEGFSWSPFNIPKIKVPAKNDTQLSTSSMQALVTSSLRNSSLPRAFGRCSFL